MKFPRSSARCADFKSARGPGDADLISPTTEISSLHFNNQFLIFVLEKQRNQYYIFMIERL
jgi:hypothetical protein